MIFPNECHGDEDEVVLTREELEQIALERADEQNEEEKENDEH